MFNANVPNPAPNQKDEIFFKPTVSIQLATIIFTVEIQIISVRVGARDMCEFRKSLLRTKYWFANFHDGLANRC